ncbi:GNAT superfamily N-acetyltransferase [Microbacterium testaceum]|uniref:GNAT family N-acetyltransferase n=1 Tax=Microbacterium testaceum TaxID=2033 RepID=UPI002780EF73|nr:GNAT family N-acetyltransferase [Microbacterium testaceum]MDQ1175003.1 GNAT superfamily N-acetyltransferase [Microbacterium testaceum]
MMIPGFISPWEEPGFDEWQRKLEVLPPGEARVRDAHPTVQDAKWMRWMQADSESANIQDISSNIVSIQEKTVLIAEVRDCAVGFCQAVTGRSLHDPLFVQMVAVIPTAQRRGVGLALLKAAAASESSRDIVVATLDGNTAARAMNERLALSIGLPIGRVPIKSYRRSDMGIGPGEKHRPWRIQRDSSADVGR